MKSHSVYFCSALGTLLFLTGTTVRAQVAPQKVVWPHRASIDESVFEPGRGGVTLHVAPNGTREGDGSRQKPLSPRAATEKLGTLMQSQDFTRQELDEVASVPLWLKIERRGAEFSTFVAPDENGQPGAYKIVGEARTLRAVGPVHLGLLANTATSQQPKDGRDAKAHFGTVRVGGKAVANWQLVKIGTQQRDESSEATLRVEKGELFLQGSGRDSGEGQWYDNGALALANGTSEGDFVLEARLQGLTPANSNLGYASLIVREKAATDGAMLQIGVRAERQADGTLKMRLRQLSRTNREKRGAPVRLLFAPGTYREGLGGLPQRDGIARNLPMVFEGEAVNGKPGGVIFDGATEEEYAPAQWQPFDLNGDGKIDASDKGVYTRAGFTPNNFFPNSNWAGLDGSNRQEGLFLKRAGENEVRLKNVVLEKWKRDGGKFSYEGLTVPTSTNVDELLPAGSFSVVETGDTQADAQLKLPTTEGDKSLRDFFAQKPHTFANTLFMRLPEGTTPADFARSDVAVAERGVAFAQYDVWPGLQPWGVGNQGVFRNFVVRRMTSDKPFQFGAWTQYVMPNTDWKWEDLHFSHLGGRVSLNQIGRVSMRNVSIEDSARGGLWGIFHESECVNVSFRRNAGGETFWNALRNVRFDNLVMEENRGDVFRNDHVAENIVIENSKFNNNLGKAMMFETAIGPVSFVNCEIKNNDPGTGQEDNGVVNIAQAHNISFDRCLFENNRVADFDFYERDRAHTANQAGNDEQANNFDHAQWDVDKTPDGRIEPGGVKPIAWNRNISVRNSTFRNRGADTMFYRSHLWTTGSPQRNFAFKRTISDELIAYNNSYFNPDNLTPFEGPDGKKLGLEDWRKNSRHAAFESGSSWGAASKPGNFVWPQPQLAASGKSGAGRVLSPGTLVYEVENLPFQTSREGRVELFNETQASGGKWHKLQVKTVGETGDWVQYALDVPQTGTYFVDVRYLQDSAGFNHFGYVQLSVDGEKVGSWFDQSGLTKTFLTQPLGPLRLTKGTHQFRFDSVHRNGYISGDYDLSLDAITLSTALNARGATKVGATEPGLKYEVFSGDYWQLPDFKTLKAQDEGQIANFDLAPVEDLKAFAIHYNGFLQVPRDGIYTFWTRVNDGGNLYIGDTLVIDNDGMHDGEKNEPWIRPGAIALKAGKHPIRLDFFNNSFGKGLMLEVWWQGPSLIRQLLANSALGGVDGPPAEKPTGPNLINGNVNEMKPFAKRMKGNNTVSESGDWPQPWSINTWDAATTGEVGLETEPTTRKTAIALRNIEGTPATQFYTWKTIDLPPGRYELSFEYLLPSSTPDELRLNFKTLPQKAVALPPSKTWKRLAETVEISEAGEGLSPQFRHLSSGQDNSLYLRKISLRRLQKP